jgi:hypothetical protein
MARAPPGADIGRVGLGEGQLLRRLQPGGASNGIWANRVVAVAAEAPAPPELNDVSSWVTSEVAQNVAPHAANNNTTPGTPALNNDVDHGRPAPPRLSASGEPRPRGVGCRAAVSDVARPPLRAAMDLVASRRPAACPVQDLGQAAFGVSALHGIHASQRPSCLVAGAALPRCCLRRRPGTPPPHRQVRLGRRARRSGPEKVPSRGNCLHGLMRTVALCLKDRRRSAGGQRTAPFHREARLHTMPKSPSPTAESRSVAPTGVR